MKLKAKIDKKLVDDNGNKWKIGDDIYFVYIQDHHNYKNKEYDCWGVIKEITDESITLVNVQIDLFELEKPLEIKFSQIKNGKIKDTDNGYY